MTKQLNEGFKRSVYWNEYKSKIDLKNLNKNQATDIRIYLDASFQGVNRLFVLAFDNSALANSNDGAKRVKRDSLKKCLVPRVDITKYNVLTDGKNFYDQPINDIIKKYDKIRKIATEKGDDYTTGCLLDYQYFKNHFKLIAVDFSKQKELDADPRAIQQIEFYEMLDTNSQVCTVLEK